MVGLKVNSMALLEHFQAILLKYIKKKVGTNLTKLSTCLEEAPAPLEEDKKEPPKTRCRGTFVYEAQADGELGFKEGDVIIVLLQARIFFHLNTY